MIICQNQKKILFKKVRHLFCIRHTLQFYSQATLIVFHICIFQVVGRFVQIKDKKNMTQRSTGALLKTHLIAIAWMGTKLAFNNFQIKTNHYILRGEKPLDVSYREFFEISRKTINFPQKPISFTKIFNDKHFIIGNSGKNRVASRQKSRSTGYNVDEQ